jgi:biopolymer transport protein ExbD
MDNSQVDVTIQQKGTIITNISQIKEIVNGYTDNSTGYALSKLAKVDQKTISTLLNKEDYNPSFETVVKLMTAMGKKLVIV